VLVEAEVAILEAAAVKALEVVELKGNLEAERAAVGNMIRIKQRRRWFGGKEVESEVGN